MVFVNQFFWQAVQGLVRKRGSRCVCNIFQSTTISSIGKGIMRFAFSCTSAPIAALSPPLTVMTEENTENVGSDATVFTVWLCILCNTSRMSAAHSSTLSRISRWPMVSNGSWENA